MNEEYKVSISLFEPNELATFDNHIHEIIEEYSKMMFKEKDQILTQRIIMKQEEEIERLHSIIKDLQKQVEDNSKWVDDLFLKDEEIEAKKKKRSKNANAYFWELLQQLCYEMNLDVIQEYRKRVKELGIFRQWEIETKNIPTFIKMWEQNGIAWFTEIVEQIQDITVINAYYGSSSYSSSQMCRLITNLVQDCKQIGIQTLDDLELEELMRSEYDKN